MVTKLHGQLKRELAIKGRAYIVTLDEEGMKLTLKGRRLGQALKWQDLSTGDAALAAALNASITRSNDAPRETAVPKRRRSAAR